jgi:hypothetical protein
MEQVERNQNFINSAPHAYQLADTVEEKKVAEWSIISIFKEPDIHEAKNA